MRSIPRTMLQPRIHAVLCRQFAVRAALDDFVFLQHDDAIHIFDRFAAKKVCPHNELTTKCQMSSSASTIGFDLTQA